MAAVMSMVGYVVGLGDRHNENILLDAKVKLRVSVRFGIMINVRSQLGTSVMLQTREFKALRTDMVSDLNLGSLGVLHSSYNFLP